MRLTKEQKGLAVLEWLEVGEQTKENLRTMTQMSNGAIRDGIDWLRDYDPNCIVVRREKGQYFYKLAVDGDEVREYVHGRAKTLYRMALRLERMVTLAVVKWPENKVLRIMARHLTRMREDIEELNP